MSSQKSLVIKIFAVGHRKIVDFPALAKNDKQLSFLQKSDAFLSQFNPQSTIRGTDFLGIGPCDIYQGGCIFLLYISRGDLGR